VVDSLTATERRTYTFQGIEFIDDPCSPDPNGEIRSLRGTDNQEKIWNYFMDIGLKPEQAAGIMGNIQTESAGTWSPVVFQTQADPWDPNLGLGHAVGIAQWDGSRRYNPPEGGLLGSIKKNMPELAQYMDPSYDPRRVPKKELPPGVEDALLLFELNYLVNESKGRPVTYTALGVAANEWETLKLQQTVEDATLFWHNNFEISAQSQEDVKRIRGGHAQAILEKFGGAATSGACNAAMSGFDATVLAYAWPEWKGSPFTEMMPAWKSAVEQAQANDMYAGYPPGIDCGGFVTLLMINSGFEPEYNFGGKLSRGAGNTIRGQIPWLQANWESLGPATSIDTSTLQKGDVAISEGHTFVFVGEIEGFASSIASASQYDRAPMADDKQSPTAPGFTWYRKKR
jgi:hypothetical protein